MTCLLYTRHDRRLASRGAELVAILHSATFWKPSPQLRALTDDTNFVIGQNTFLSIFLHFMHSSHIHCSTATNLIMISSVEQLAVWTWLPHTWSWWGLCTQRRWRKDKSILGENNLARASKCEEEQYSYILTARFAVSRAQICAMFSCPLYYLFCTTWQLCYNIGIYIFLTSLVIPLLDQSASLRRSEERTSTG